jgi:glycosyltransferase involved in cell wall biosynthesis
MLDVLFTITRYWPAIGGAEIHTRALIHHLEPSIRSTIAAHWAENRTDWLLGTTLAAPSRPRIYQDDGREVNLLAATPADRVRSLPWVLSYYPLMPTAAPRLGHLLAEHLLRVAPTVGLVHNVRSGREPLSLASLEVARRRQVAFVFTPNHHPRWVGWRYQVYLDLYRRADAVIALTEHERQALIRLGVSAERVHVTGIGPVLSAEADGERARQHFGLGERFVLFLGQKYAYKGARELLEAAPYVWQRHPDVQFVFVGPRTRSSQSLFARVSDPRVREFGAVSVQDKTDLLAACEHLCVPSSQESFGGVLVEAWAMGKPVVAGPAAAAAEVIADGDDGLFVPEQSARAIADRVILLLDDPAAAAVIGERGARKVAERFTWPRLAERTEAIYRSLR